MRIRFFAASLLMAVVMAFAMPAMVSAMPAMDSGPPGIQNSVGIDLSVVLAEHIIAPAEPSIVGDVAHAVAMRNQMPLLNADWRGRTNTIKDGSPSISDAWIHVVLAVPRL